MHAPQGPPVSPAVLAAMLLVVAASCEVTLFESEAFMRSSRRDSTLNVLQARTATRSSHNTACSNRLCHKHVRTEQKMLPAALPHRQGQAMTQQHSASMT
jgi:hypothetical protein